MPEFLDLKFVLAILQAALHGPNASFACQSPSSSKMVFAVTLRDGLPWNEKPPSTVWLPSGVGA